MATYSYTRSIAFHETDAAGVVHFSRLLCLVEEAEHAALASLGIPLFTEEIAWPRVQLSVSYPAPIQTGEQAEVSLAIERLGKSSVRWKFSIRSVEKDRIVAEGTMTTVCSHPAGYSRELGEWRESLESLLVSDL